jgi:hypothetical protein
VETSPGVEKNFEKFLRLIDAAFVKRAISQSPDFVSPSCGICAFSGMLRCGIRGQGCFEG